MTDFVFEHTDNLVLHGFPAVRVKMDFDLIGRFADTLHEVGLFGFRGRIVFIGIHIINPFRRVCAL